MVILPNGQNPANHPTGNPIQTNAISDHGRLGINLVGNDLPTGVTPNDPGDADAGPNTLQNYPLLTAAFSSGGSVTVQETLNRRQRLTADDYTTAPTPPAA